MAPSVSEQKPPLQGPFPEDPHASSKEETARAERKEAMRMGTPDQFGGGGGGLVSSCTHDERSKKRNSRASSFGLWSS